MQKFHDLSRWPFGYEIIWVHASGHLDKWWGKAYNLYHIIYISSISHHLYHNHSLFSNISQLQNADLNSDLPVLPKPLRSRHGAPHRSALRGGTAPAAVGAGEFGRRSGSRACRYRRSMMIYVDWLGWFLDVFGQGSKINMAQKCEIYMLYMWCPALRSQIAAKIWRINLKKQDKQTTIKMASWLLWLYELVGAVPGDAAEPARQRRARILLQEMTNLGPRLRSKSSEDGLGWGRPTQEWWLDGGSYIAWRILKM